MSKYSLIKGLAARSMAMLTMVQKIFQILLSELRLRPAKHVRDRHLISWVLRPGSRSFVGP